jgi:hypothetical protein
MLEAQAGEDYREDACVLMRRESRARVSIAARRMLRAETSSVLHDATLSVKTCEEREIRTSIFAQTQQVRAKWAIPSQ